MSEQGSAVPVTPETDDIDGDLRNAIEELKIERPQEARVTIDKPERPRDEEGKFAPKADEEKPKRETLRVVPEAKPAEGIQVAPSQQIPNPAAPVAKAPNGWNDAAKEAFKSLPPESQKYISQWAENFERKVTVQDEERLLGKKVNEMATPYLPTIRAEGATVEKAFQDYLQTAHVLRSGTPQQKAQSLAAVAVQFGVDSNQLFYILQNGNVQNGSHVQPSAYDPRLETLQQRLDRIEQERTQEIQQRQLQETHSLNSQIEDFAAKPGHEHFEKVRLVMGTLLENGIANDLDDAYERAIYADPEIRLGLVAAQTQADQGKRLTELKATTERAKSAAVSVTGGPGSSRPLNGAGSVGSIEDDLRAAMREHTGRV